MELLKEQTLFEGCEEDTVRRICFICTGNTCRSPMAEAVTNAYCEENGRRDLRAFSAGLYANENEPISEDAVRALTEANVTPVKGRDYRRHLAHTLRLDEAEAYDLLVCMSTEHMMQLLMRYPHLSPKLVCMPTPIPDPYGRGAEVYRATLEEIRRGVMELIFSEREA